MTLGTGIAVAGIAIGIGVMAFASPVAALMVGMLAIVFTAMVVAGI